jgi:hypothetical protein
MAGYGARFFSFLLNRHENGRCEMNTKEKAMLALGALLMASAILLKIAVGLTVEQFAVLLSMGFIIFMHPLDYKKRALNARDEFIRRVNLTSMARSWRATQYLVIVLLFGSVLRWITLSAIWMLIIVSVFLTLSHVLFMIPLFKKGDVE